MVLLASRVQGRSKERRDRDGKKPVRSPSFLFFHPAKILSEANFDDPGLNSGRKVNFICFPWRCASRKRDASVTCPNRSSLLPNLHLSLSPAAPPFPSLPMSLLTARESNQFNSFLSSLEVEESGAPGPSQWPGGGGPANDHQGFSESRGGAADQVSSTAGSKKIFVRSGL